MDIASLQYLGPSGYTLSVEEKASLSISMLQRSREVGDCLLWLFQPGEGGWLSGPVSTKRGAAGERLRSCANVRRRCCCRTVKGLLLFNPSHQNSFLLMPPPPTTPALTPYSLPPSPPVCLSLTVPRARTNMARAVERCGVSLLFFSCVSPGEPREAHVLGKIMGETNDYLVAYALTPAFVPDGNSSSARRRTSRWGRCRT